MKKEAILELIIETIQDVVPMLEDTEIAPEQSFRDLGINSLERTEVTILIVDELEVDIPRIELLKAKNIGELVDLLFNSLS